MIEYPYIDVSRLQDNYMIYVPANVFYIFSTKLPACALYLIQCMCFDLKTSFLTTIKGCFSFSLAPLTLTNLETNVSLRVQMALDEYEKDAHFCLYDEFRIWMSRNCLS